SDLVAERLVQVVEEGETAVEAGLVVRVRHENPQEELLDAARLRMAELSVLDVDVVDDLGHARQRRVLHVGPEHQRLERATVFLVREVTPDHVEADLVRPDLVRTRIDEPEPSPWIQEAPHEPCRGNAVDLDPFPRHPRPTDELAMTGCGCGCGPREDLTLESRKAGLRVPAGG